MIVIEVSDYIHASSQLAQTTMRSVLLGEAELDELSSRRGKLNSPAVDPGSAHRILGPEGDPVEVKQVELTEQMIRGIAREAEGTVSAAQMSFRQRDASRRETGNSRRGYLQTPVEIGEEQSAIIVFPCPWA